MLLAVGYDGRVPLIDPLCGSGTIAIEAAWIARCRAPGQGRRFTCERWPRAPSAAFEAARTAARAATKPGAGAPIVASDRDAGAIEACLANADRAGASSDVVFRRAALSAIEPPPDPGFVITNPPYGERVGERSALRNLYAQLGNVLRAQCAGWTLAMVSSDRALDAQTKLRFDEVLRFDNGGIRVRLVRAGIE
jgi:putative N6-adenine-specific DNA methylase